MREGTFELPRDDGATLFVYRWAPDAASARGVVQIAHGLSEHAGRYARVAEVLTRAGFVVYADDHRGHGKTARRDEDLGHFADRNGFAKVVADLRALNRRIGEAEPGVPVVLFGHSMGAMLTQAYVLQHGSTLAGALLSGASGHAGALASVGRVIARAERLRLGMRGRSALLQSMSFSGFNRGFEGRTPFDWLSRDTTEVDAYAADPRCGFALTVQGWLDVLDGVRVTEDRAAMRSIPRELPIHVFSGAEDPVGHRTRGPQWVLDAYRDAGLARVTHKFYPGGRHEMLNETNRDEVHSDLVAWLDGIVRPRASAPH